MEIKRLDHTDFNEIKDLFWKCHLAEAERAKNKFNSTSDISVDQIDDLWKIWIAGIQRYYLIDDDHHYLYGIFENTKLMAMVGWRCDLPAPYENDWVIVYLKADPSKNALIQYMKPLWEFMFNTCESRGLTSWHSLIQPNRWSKFDAFYQRMIPSINNGYDYVTLCEIPAGTQPNIDWVWGMMGRRTLKSDYIVRTGIKKNENV
jgi:hypothetical protein